MRFRTISRKFARPFTDSAACTYPQTRSSRCHGKQWRQQSLRANCGALPPEATAAVCSPSQRRCKRNAAFMLAAAVCSMPMHALAAPTAFESSAGMLSDANRLQISSQRLASAKAAPSRVHAASGMTATACEAPSVVHAQPVASVADEACPEREGIRKYICYGPCCGIPWGPGGPICLALSAAAFRYAMPYTFVNWFRRDVKQQDDKEPEKSLGVDAAGLAFSAALFASAAPRTAAGVAYSFTFLVLCLL